MALYTCALLDASSILRLSSPSAWLVPAQPQERQLACPAASDLVTTLFGHTHASTL